MPTLIDSMLIPSEYMGKDPMTATEIRARMGEPRPILDKFSRSMDAFVVEVLERICRTPIQFRFPRSKKKRIRKKWRKDPRNFKPLLSDQFEDIQIVG